MIYMSEEIDLNKLSDEEKATLAKLMEKATVTSNPGAVSSNPTEDRAFGEAPKPNPSTVTRVLEPTDWVKRQIDTLKSVGRTNYLQGVKAPKKDPIKAGIAAQDKYENQMKKDEVLKRRAEALGKTNIDEWTSMAETLGADKLVDGVTKRQYKVERFVAKFQPLLKTHLSKIDAMPDATDGDRESKMLENLRGLKALKGKA